MVVLTNLSVCYSEYANNVRQILQEHFKVVELGLSLYDDMRWAYIKSIQTDSVIIVPGIENVTLDMEALEQIKVLYPQYAVRVYQVQMHDFIKDGGGALDCCSLTYKNVNQNQ